MIIDIRRQIRSLPETVNYFSKQEIEDRVDKVLAYMRMEIAARKIALSKIKP